MYHDNNNSAVIAQYGQLFIIYMGLPFIMKRKIRRKGEKKVQLHKYQNRNCECWHPLSPSCMLIFLASSDWPSITERWWPSAWPANRPVNVNNQPVTCYGETGSAPEKYKNMKDDISVFALPFCGIITSSANTRPDTGAIQGWHKNEILSP